MGGRPGGAADFTGGAADSTGERLCGVGHGRGAARVRDFRRATTGSVEEIYEKPERADLAELGTDRIARGRRAL